MFVSVVIPCKNEVGVVDHLLESLKVQTRKVDEVIVVDSHSSDGTAAHALSIKDNLPLITVVAKNTGLANARNEGAAHARGELVFFIDADVRLEPDFIEKALDYICRCELDCGGFTQRMQSQKLGLRFGARMMNGYARLMQHTPWPIAFSCLFSSRRCFRAIDGFDPKIFIMEDYDFMLRARQAKLRTGIVNVPFAASDRRYVGPGRASIWRGVYAEIYRYTHGLRITKPIFKYEMGGQSPTDTSHGRKK